MGRDKKIASSMAAGFYVNFLNSQRNHFQRTSLFAFVFALYRTSIEVAHFGERE